MDWEIRKTDKFKYHTYLKEILKPIIDDIGGFDWLISDLDYIAFTDTDLLINFEEDHFILSNNQFMELLDTDIQFLFGVFLAIPNNVKIHIDTDHLPYADLNKLVWKKGNIQHPDAMIELICFDSSSTIVKFRDESLSRKFHKYFEEALELKAAE
jgi:hypothetical protein